MRLLAIMLMLTACGEPEILPTCQNITASYDGNKLRLEIDSDAEFVTICRDLGTRTKCTKYDADYFGCISMSANTGDVITVTESQVTCTITVQP